MRSPSNSSTWLAQLMEKTAVVPGRVLSASFGNAWPGVRWQPAHGMVRFASREEGAAGAIDGVLAVERERCNGSCSWGIGVEACGPCGSRQPRRGACRWRRCIVVAELSRISTFGEDSDAR